MLSLLSVPPALCFCVPLVVAAFALRTLCLRQHRQFLPISSLALLSLAILASVAGILGLKASTGLFTLSRIQLIVDNILYAELGVCVLYLAVKHNNPAPWLPRSRHIKLYTGLLFSFLFCATAIGLATPFVHAIPPIVSPLVFLIFTLSTLPLLVHLIYIHCYPPNPSPLKKPSKFSKPRKKLVKPSVTVPGPISLPRLTRPSKNTTAITVLIPPPLPSPASSSASFPETDQTSKQHSHFKHPSDAEDFGPNEGSSCSTAILSGTKTSAKLHEESELGHNTDYAEHMDTDLEASPQFSSFTPTTAPSALAINIRKRAMRLRTRSRSILIILLISQTFAILSGTLLLVLGISDDAITASTALLRIIETAFIVLCVSGFTFAFYVHGSPLDKGLSPPQSLATPGSITISIARRQDQEGISPATMYHTDGDKAVVQGDMIPHFVVESGDYPGTSSSNLITNPAISIGRGKYGLGIDKIFSSAKSHFRQQEIRSPRRNHEHLGSASSSFTSPRPKRPPIAVFDPAQYDDEKVEDEGIELPVLARAQLPSPPTTPRVRGADQSWHSSRHYSYDHHDQRDRNSLFDQEVVRVGVMRPGIKVNVIREFDEQGKYLEAVADVVDTAVSEPGCTSSLGGGGIAPVSSEPRSPRVWFSQCTFSPTSTKSPVIINDGPTSPSLKSLTLTLSPKSPTFSIFRSSTNPGSPRSTWKRAQRIKERLKRPLTFHHHSAAASSPNATSSNFSAATARTSGHRRAGSASKIAEWYPFTSKSKQRKTTEDKDRDTYWRGEEGQNGGEGGIEMADFVDLTDPFASPTPGFALPKWVENGTAGSSSDVGHHRARSMSGGRSELVSMGSTKGKERDWDGGGGQWENGKFGGVAVTSKTTVWGRVPVVIGSEPEYDRDVGVMDFPSMLRTERRGKGCTTRHVSTKERKVGGRAMKRPDSPMPVPAISSFTHSRSMSIDRVVEVLEDAGDAPMNVGVGLGSSLKRKSEPIGRKESRQSLRSVQDGAMILKPPVPVLPKSGSYFSTLPQPLPWSSRDESEFGMLYDGDGKGRLSRRDKGKHQERTGNGSPIPTGARTRLGTSLRRKGSPVPMMFRSSSGGGGDASFGGRHVKGIPLVSSTSTQVLQRETIRSLNAERRGGDYMFKRYLEDEPSVEVELNLEEMLLAQRLLKRLDSVYYGDDDELEDAAG